MADKICRKAWVSGRVQGVYYRAATQRMARQHGVTGWAKNLPDGRVEVLLCGAVDDVEQVYRWLFKGPDMARVESVRGEDQAYEELEGFITR